MKTFLISFISALITMFAIDAVWLTSMSGFYRKHLGHLMTDTFSISFAGIFYVLYAVVISVLVVVPAFEGNTETLKVFGYGALLGLAAYGAYDLTNHATLKEWPLVVTLVDMFWGALLTSIVAVIATSVVRFFVS